MLDPHSGMTCLFKSAVFLTSILSFSRLSWKPHCLISPMCNWSIYLSYFPCCVWFPLLCALSTSFWWNLAPYNYKYSLFYYYCFPEHTLYWVNENNNLKLKNFTYNFFEVWSEERKRPAQCQVELNYYSIANPRSLYCLQLFTMMKWYPYIRIKFPDSWKWQ